MGLMVVTVTASSFAAKRADEIPNIAMIEAVFDLGRIPGPSD
jgi:hypothetical protein